MISLEEIVAHKRREVADRKGLVPERKLMQSPHFDVPCISLRQYLRRPGASGVIAEIKRASPSAGVFKERISVEHLSIGYMQGGASALSVITDSKYFGGRDEYLLEARRWNFCPILRKDFTVDEYQVIEAKALGADVILLIAEALSPEMVQRLARAAKELGLETILEVHSADALERTLHEGIDIVGVNNRNLHTFAVETRTSFTLAERIPDSFLRIAESGLRDARTILELWKAGYEGFLIGEAFMRASAPERACAKLVKEVRALQQESGNDA